MKGVSILIPAYNAAETIIATLNSCLFDRKSLQEIIVVDDGSTDSTARLVETWSCEHDITLKLVRTRNKGGCAARNTAIASSTGDTLLWLDADDLLTPGKVAQIAQKARTHPHHISCTPWIRFQSYQSFKLIPSQTWLKVPYASSPNDWLARDIHAVPHCYGGKRTLFEQAGPWDESLKMNQDGEYFARVIAKSQGVIFSPEPVVFYRQSSSGSVSHFNPSKADSLFRSIESLERTSLKLEDSTRMRQMISNRWQHFIYTVYPHAENLRNQAEFKIKHLPKPSIANPNAVSPLSKTISLLLGWKVLTQLRRLRIHQK